MCMAVVRPLEDQEVADGGWVLSVVLESGAWGGWICTADGCKVSYSAK